MESVQGKEAREEGRKKKEDREKTECNSGRPEKKRQKNEAREGRQRGIEM